MSDVSTPYASKLIRWSYVMVSIVLLIALLVLVGWWFEIDLLKRIIPGVVAMNPLTAVCFILTASAFFLLLSPRARYRQSARILLALVAFLAVFVLVEYVAGEQTGIDTWMFRERVLTDRQGAISNHMAVNTAFCFLLLSAALWLINRPGHRVQRIAAYLGLTSLSIAFLAVIGYLYVVDYFYQLLVYAPMALHTAISFFMLSLALFFAYPQQAMMTEIVSPRAGGVLARRILPAIFLIPVILGFLVSLGEWQEIFGPDFGLALFTLGSILLFLIIVWRLIKLLNRFAQAKEEAEEALQETNRRLTIQTTQLETSNRELESFSYSVSHDLRAPLRAIGGYAQVLREEGAEQLNDSEKELLQKITHNAEKMGELIDELLHFSRVGKSSIHQSPLNMGEIACNTFKKLVVANKETVDFRVDPMPLAEGDDTLITLLYQNLISNAIKYSSKKSTPRIRVGATSQGKETIYFVEDNGVGFDMRHYDKLFGVFHRLHTQKEFSGHGVGLAIVQKIVLAHSGKVWAESTVDEGATFYFTLSQGS